MHYGQNEIQGRAERDKGRTERDTEVEQNNIQGKTERDTG